MMWMEILVEVLKSTSVSGVKKHHHLKPLVFQGEGFPLIAWAMYNEMARRMGGKLAKRGGLRLPGGKTLEYYDIVIE